MSAPSAGTSRGTTGGASGSTAGAGGTAGGTAGGATGGTTGGTPSSAAPVIWKTNPFAGNFNPGTKIGHSIFLEKTKGLKEEDRYDLTKTNSTKIHQYFRARETSMGDIVRSVPIEWNPDGSIRKTANLLTQYQQISIQHCQRSAIECYSTALGHGAPIPAGPFLMQSIDPANSDPDKIKFYSRVNRSVVMQVIKNGLSASGWEDLMLEKDKFTYSNPNGEVEYDGVSMMLLIYRIIDPSTMVGFDTILKKIENARLGNHNNCVKTLLTAIETNYGILAANGKAPENYRRLIFDALSSGPNHAFNDYIARMQDDVEAGIGVYKDITPGTLISASRSKYNNMVDKDLWGKVDPRDAKLLALTTKYNSLLAEQKKTATALATSADKATSQGGGGGGGGGNPSNKAWNERLTNDKFVDGLLRERTIKDGESKVIDGQTFHWCPHHKHPKGLWDGLYVKHTADQHDEVCKRRGKTTKSTAATTATAGTTAPGDGAGSGTAQTGLQLTDKLKEVMCTNLFCTSDDVDKIFAQVQEN